ncbi:MAG TPA: AAA family ATPase [Dehalococcoidia bacterium]|nr:AAA family ATPase [Dehalococcoidia bacterium]
MPHLVVIYGAPLSGKSTLARELAAAFTDKTALLSVDRLAGDAIVVPDEDVFSELEMAHTQARLLVANYLKNRYNVVLEGAFFYERGGELHRYEQEIDQIVALMRNLARAPVLVRLSASEETLRVRAKDQGRENEVATALRISSEYKARYGRWLDIDTSKMSVPEAVAELRERLEALDVT